MKVTLKDKIILFLDGVYSTKTCKEIALALDENPGSIRAALNFLEKKGAIKKEKFFGVQDVFFGAPHAKTTLDRFIKLDSLQDNVLSYFKSNRGYKTEKEIVQFFNYSAGNLSCVLRALHEKTFLNVKVAEGEVLSSLNVTYDISQKGLEALEGLDARRFEM